MTSIPITTDQLRGTLAELIELAEDAHTCLLADLSAEQLRGRTKLLNRLNQTTTRARRLNAAAEPGFELPEQA